MKVREIRYKALEVTVKFGGPSLAALENAGMDFGPPCVARVSDGMEVPLESFDQMVEWFEGEGNDPLVTPLIRKVKARLAKVRVDAVTFVA